MSRGDRFSVRINALKSTQRELVGEINRVRREEEYLRQKLRQAQEQVRYYEGLLTLLRRDFGQAPGLSELVRRLG